MSNPTIIIKQAGHAGADTKIFRAYNPGRTGQPDISLGISASTAGNVEFGARRCAVKAFIQRVEPTADQDEIETRIALRKLAHPLNIWEATLTPPSPTATPATAKNTRLIHWKLAAIEMPDSDLTVLIYGPTIDPEVWLGYHDGETWLDIEGRKMEPVIAWAELPEPPKN